MNEPITIAYRFVNSTEIRYLSFMDMALWAEMVERYRISPHVVLLNLDVADDTDDSCHCGHPECEAC